MGSCLWENHLTSVWVTDSAPQEATQRSPSFTSTEEEDGAPPSAEEEEEEGEAELHVHTILGMSKQQQQQLLRSQMRID